MVLWSVRIACQGVEQLSDASVDAMLEALAPYGPSLSVDPDEISIRFDVDAATRAEAAITGENLFRTVNTAYQITAIEIQTVEELEHDLGLSNTA